MINNPVVLEWWKTCRNSKDCNKCELKDKCLEIENLYIYSKENKEIDFFNYSTPEQVQKVLEKALKECRKNNDCFACEIKNDCIGAELDNDKIIEQHINTGKEWIEIQANKPEFIPEMEKLKELFKR